MSYFDEEDEEFTNEPIEGQMSIFELPQRNLDDEESEEFTNKPIEGQLDLFSYYENVKPNNQNKNEKEDISQHNDKTNLDKYKDNNIEENKITKQGASHKLKNFLENNDRKVNEIENLESNDNNEYKKINQVEYTQEDESINELIAESEDKNSKFENEQRESADNYYIKQNENYNNCEEDLNVEIN